MQPHKIELSASSQVSPPGKSSDIAIVGMAGRFPGAKNIDEYWSNLVNGVESIRRLTDDELLKAGVSRRDFEDPDYVRACPVLADIDKFDAAFFGLSPRDASVMDPAHRFFLEVAWEALENSGNTGLAEEGQVGVFAGSGAPLYWMKNVRTHREIVESMGEFLVRHTGNDMNFLATRASYDLDLRGPSINVQTACSSALVAAHLARQSLLAGECDMALIGGATIVVPMGQGYHYKEGEILSPDGHCRPFDHRSAGTVFGSGAACLIIKRLDDALDNGDTIHAVIKGSAVNNDGSVKVGFLAPGVEGQVDAIKKALKSANVSARSISYVEAHGTGTSVGDPIELTALEQAFSDETREKQFCGVGSVKSNIGHLGETAAAASMIKVALALKHRMLPPTLGYERPNPRFDMDDSPFFVNAELRQWDSSEPLRAGVNALGAGGTNCHLIMEEPPAFLPGEGGRERHLLVMSAKSKTALDRMSENLAARLATDPAVDLADAAYTLSMGRRSLAHRRVLVAKDHQEAIDLLRTANPSRVGTAVSDPSDPEVVFTFPGGGAQYARMCFDIYENEPAYKKALDECFAVIDGELDPDLRRLLFASQGEAETATRRLQQPANSLPTLFSVEYALARLFESYGIRPSAFIGHSMGEYVAACLAGVFSVRDGLRLVHLRGRLFEKTQKGRMIGVSLPEEGLRGIMPQGLSIAAVNAPELCVASGPSELIEELSLMLSKMEIDWTPIHIDVAAHSSLLDPILEEFRRFCKTIDFRAPAKPIASNYTGRWLTAAEATDPEYWVKHLRNTVRFSDCVETVLEGGNKVFLEIGPGRTLTTLVAAQKTKVRHTVNSVRHPKEAANDVDYALLTLGKVWAAGAHVDWTALYDDQIRNRVPLPGYPFDRQSYWVEPKATREEDATELVKRENLDEWFSAVSWEQTPLVARAQASATQWLLFVDDADYGRLLADELKVEVGAGCEITTVLPGKVLRRIDRISLEVKPGSIDQYRELLEQLKAEGRAPEHIVIKAGPCRSAGGDLRTGFGGWIKRWSESTHSPQLRLPILRSPSSTVDACLEANFFAPVHLAQAMSSVLEAATFTIVTERAFSVRGESIDPWARLNAGPAQVIPRELPEFPTRLIDLSAPDAEQESFTANVRQLARELCSGDLSSPVALRSPGRWTQHLRPSHLPAPDSNMNWVQDGDVVLITGGLGGIGLVLAEHLARKHRVKLALLSREGLPPKHSWAELLENSDTSPQLRRRITLVQALEALGAQVLAVRGDVTAQTSLQSVLVEIRSALGPINAVIHAAGVMDDEPLQSKSDVKMRRVLAAKVEGSVNLDALITEDLRAFVLMSSVASFLGLPGQVDYTAANAFLDAFAAERQMRKKGRTLAINWNAWRDVGMVVDAETQVPDRPLPSGRTKHPWLQASEPSPRGRRYFTDFDVSSTWLLGEHQIVGGEALIPGTGFVELARAAFLDAVDHRSGQDNLQKGIELRQVTFLSPFQVGTTQSRRIQIEVDFVDDTANIVMRSNSGQETHVTAEANLCDSTGQSIDLNELSERCNTIELTRDGFLDQDFVQFGPRWQNIKEIRLGEREAVIRLALTESFAGDLGVFAYHPALLDMATGAAQVLVPGFRKGVDFFVPFGYDRIRIYSSVNSRVVSHVRLRPETTADVAAFDVSLYGEDGAELIAIEGFTMRRVETSAGITRKTHDQSYALRSKHNPTMQALLRDAITKAEGVIAFERALAQTEMSQVVASSVDVNVWLRKLSQDAKRLKAGDGAEAGSSFSRPALTSDYVKPESGAELELAAIWSKLLGITDVGVLDDFFELGGNSLVAVRFFARVKKDFGVNLPLSTLFQAPTIRHLAEALRDHGYTEKATDALPISSRPSPAAEGESILIANHPWAAVNAPLLIRPGKGKLPIFFIHDGLGEVLLYRSLALKLDAGHAVYGLEPEMSGGRFVHTNIVDMARAKVERIRTIQRNGPYLLAGLCAGGVIAFEVARQLQDSGEQAVFVGIIDASDVAAEERKFRIARERVKRVFDTMRMSGDESLWTHLVSQLATLFHKGVNLLHYEISTRLERAKNVKLISSLKKSQDTGSVGPSEIGFIRLYELAHKEHIALGTFHGGRVVLFRATQGDGSVGDVPFREIYTDPLLGWQKRVRETVQVIDVPGGHSSALQEPHVDVLAKAMQFQMDLATNKVNSII